MSHLRICNYQNAQNVLQNCILDKNKDLLEFSCETIYKNYLIFSQKLNSYVSLRCVGIYFALFFWTKM